MHRMFALLMINYVQPLFPLIVLVTTVYFLRRCLKVLDRRADAKAELTELRARVAQLEEAQNAVERDVTRLQAGQEFVSRLWRGRADEMGQT